MKTKTGIEGCIYQPKNAWAGPVRARRGLDQAPSAPPGPTTLPALGSQISGLQKSVVLCHSSPGRLMQVTI